MNTAHEQDTGRIIAEQLRNPDDLDISLRMEFGPFETVHRWRKMLECDEFVGAKRSKHTAVAYKDAIYVFGGDNGKSMLNDLIRFDTKENSWTKVGCLGMSPAPRYHHSAVVHRSSMFVFGGYTGDILANSNLTNKNDLFEYKFPSAQWVQWKFTGPQQSSAPSEPVPRSAHGAAVYDDKLWIFAGYDGNARLNDMWTMKLEGENHVWECVTQTGDCPPTCCNFPVVVARGKMFVFSGQSGANITNALYQFDFESLTWSRVCSEHMLRLGVCAPARRYGHVMVAHSRHLYVFGGAADNTLPNDVHCYDLDSSLWHSITPAANSEVPSGRLFHAAAVVGDALYVFGGTIDNNVRSGELFRFQLSDYPPCTLHEDFGRILVSQQFCDVAILLGAEETPILAHQALLAARSSFLRTRIAEAQEEFEEQIATGEVKPPEEKPRLVIKMPDATPEAFKMVLDYIYTDRIETPEQENNPASAASVLEVVEVLVLALRFEIPRLRALASRFLRANLGFYNVLPAMHAAHRAGLACIKEYCIKFVIKDYMFQNIVMSPDFETMDQKLMVEVIRRRHLISTKPPPPDPEEEIPGTTLEHDMRQLLQLARSDSAGALCDIRLRVGGPGGTCRAAHRSVLAARASYFEAMFRSFSPTDNIVNIQICDTIPSEAALDSLLHYIYYGDTIMPTEDSLYLFQAPIFYGFTNNRLQVFCKHNLQSNVTADNVLAILTAADRMNASDIKDYALKLITNEFGYIAKQEGIRYMSQPLLVEIVYSLAEEPRIQALFALEPRSIKTSVSADTLCEEAEYLRLHRKL